MKVIGITVLALIAFFTGGCSLVSLVAFGRDSFTLSVPGLIIAGLCVWGIRSMTRPLPDLTIPPPSDEDKHPK